jgi:hypothetical protein
MNPFMCMQSVLGTSIYLHSLIKFCSSFFLIFKIFNSFFFKILYRTGTVVCQNMLKATVQHTAMKPMQYFVSVVR